MLDEAQKTPVVADTAKEPEGSRFTSEQVFTYFNWLLVLDAVTHLILSCSGYRFMPKGDDIGFLVVGMIPAVAFLVFTFAKKGDAVWARRVVLANKGYLYFSMFVVFVQLMYGLFSPSYYCEEMATATLTCDKAFSRLYAFWIPYVIMVPVWFYCIMRMECFVAQLSKADSERLLDKGVDQA